MGMIIFLAMGCVAHRLERSEPRFESLPYQALVTFCCFVDSAPLAVSPVEVWDGSKYLGRVRGPAVIQHLFTPGKHILMFFAGGKWSGIRAELKRGQHYVISLSTMRDGNGQPKFCAVPVKRGEKGCDIAWLYRLLSSGNVFCFVTPTKPPKPAPPPRLIEEIEAARMICPVLHPDMSF
ncbi:MAG: hypothetical protein D6820_18150 [Lentisphaerae bacterium]|nr:MAG: hypothetical protein D6820_18150 [Lentisphaerota bacterium]